MQNTLAASRSLTNIFITNGYIKIDSTSIENNKGVEEIVGRLSSNVDRSRARTRQV